MLMALLSQAGTTVNGAYNVLVSMTVLAAFLPYGMLFAALIRAQFKPAGPQVRRVPGGKPVAILLGCLGILSAVTAIVLSTIPSADEPNKALVVLKVVGGTGSLIAAGAAVFLFSRWKTRAHLSTCPKFVL